MGHTDKRPLGAGPLNKTESPGKELVGEAKRFRYVLCSSPMHRVGCDPVDRSSSSRQLSGVHFDRRDPR